ncbi:MAG: beta-propeller domain-containing protein [Deltaproteobacteria bacterium]|nr:beta-propeller domain-containing protein [Deltaproteobacteria bacterium]
MLRTNPIRFLLLAMATAMFGVAACSEADTHTGPVDSGDRLDWTRAAALTAAQTCDEAGAAFKAAAITNMEMELDRTERCYLGEGGCWRWLEGDVANGGDPQAAPPSTNDDETPDEWSETNTQVEGVDEADFVKTDGTSIIALFGKDLVKLSSWPAAATHITGRATLRAWPQHFFLTDGKAVVLSQASYYDFLSPEDKQAMERGEYPRDVRWWSGLTLVSTYDVTGDVPTLVSERLIDGYTIANRRIDDKVYLAQSTWVYIEGLRYWPENLGNEPTPDEVKAEFDAMRAQNRAIIEALPLDYWMPRELTIAADGTIADTAGTAFVDCDQIWVPSVHSGQSLLTVATYDIDDDTLSGSTVQGNWGNVYASKDALYVATTNWDFYWWWEGDVMAPPLTTHVHKFAIGDDGLARYAASGSVLGYAINQFSFDEHQGVLRVATTDGFGWWNNGESQTQSRVTTLAQNGKKLDVQGVVDGLGLGEQIYAVRFVGDRGYVVTFRQVDPLYVLDLANPTEPEVVGELKVPGFSSYIHPIDGDHLLTIGRDATDEGQVQGLKLEVFDVSDPTAPKSTATAILGDGWNTWSEAQYDHHAFVYYPARKLLAIPVSGWADTGGGYWSYKSELFVFKVDATSVTDLGASITHTPFLEALDVNMGCRSWYGWYEAWIRRGIFVEDYVYSLSNLGVMVHDTRDFTQGAVASVLAIDGDDWWQGGVYWDPCEGDKTETDAR